MAGPRIGQEAAIGHIRQISGPHEPIDPLELPHDT